MLLSSTYICPPIGRIPRIQNYRNKIQKKRNILCQSTTTNAAVTKSIGIANYFQGKNILVTGGTGLLGKGGYTWSKSVLVESILRSTSVGKIYVLVRAEDIEAAMDRLAKELINSELFGCLRRSYGKYYDELIREKLIPVVGNIFEPNLGMDPDSAREIVEDVNVIIESAAITTLNERYDLLLQTNVKGPQAIISFAKSCKNLEVLVHISSAYVNGQKEGVILETPMIKGENRRNDTSSMPRLDIDNEVALSLKSSTCTSNYEMTKNMKKLGMERARLYGWHNAYHMSKAMAEMVVHEISEDLPVLIIRPSVIESCYRGPFAGWIEGFRMYDPVIISYGKGQLPAYLGDPDAAMDIIPLDIVANATIAAIAKHGHMQKPELFVYQIASSVVNPLLHREFFDYVYEYFSSDPLVKLENFSKISYYDNVARIKYFNNFDDFSNYTREEISRRIGIKDADPKNPRLQRQLKANVSYAEQLCKLYEFAGFYQGRFHSGNTQNLLSEMSKEEQINFGIDIKEINWKKYFQEIHIPGLRKHVLHERMISIKQL